MVLTAPSKYSISGFERLCDIRGTQSGKSRRSAGSSVPTAWKKRLIACSIVSGSFSMPVEKMVSPRMSSVTRCMSFCTSIMRPGRMRAQRSARASALRAIAAEKECTMRGVKIGAMARRCARHTSPSAVSRPSWSPGDRTRFCSASLW